MSLDAGTVLIAITLLAIPLAAVSFARAGSAWAAIGKGPLAIEPGPPPSLEATEMPSAGDPELRAEVRGHIEAENARRRRRGEPALGLETETERRIANLIGSGR